MNPTRLAVLCLVPLASSAVAAPWTYEQQGEGKGASYVARQVDAASGMTMVYDCHPAPPAFSLSLLTAEAWDSAAQLEEEVTVDFVVDGQAVAAPAFDFMSVEDKVSIVTYPDDDPDGFGVLYGALLTANESVAVSFLDKSGNFSLDGFRLATNFVHSGCDDF